MDLSDPSVLAAARLLLSHLAEAEKKSPTMRELWEVYWATEGQHLRSSVRTAISWKMVKGIVGKDGVRFEDRESMKVDAEAVEELRAGLVHSPLTGKVTKPATRNRTLELVQRLLTWAARNRRIPYTPLPSLKLEPENNIRQSLIRTDEEFSRLMARIEHPHLRVLVLVLFDSGMRFHEAVNLRRNQLARRPEGGAIVELSGDQTKTGKARRVCLTKRATDALGTLPDRGPYFFAKRTTGQPYSYSFFQKMYQLAADTCGIQCAPGERITLHSLRHSALYRMRAIFRWPTSRIKLQSGHTTDSAFQRYGLIDVAEMETSMAEMDRMLPPKIDPATGANSTPLALVRENLAR